MTKKTVENLPISPSRALYHDTHIKRLVIVVHPSGRKVWQVYKKMSGKPAPVRVTLGTYPDLTPFLARQQATEKIADISKGINPNQAKQAKRNKGVILEQVYKDYLEARTLKPGTVYDYKRLMDEQLSDWKKKPIKSITPDDVAIKHKKESKTSPARANNMGRLLRALFNFAIANYLNEIGEKIYTINPVSKLSETRAWNPNKRRKTLIKAVDLPDWYQAAQDMNTKLFLRSATVSRLYLLTLLFTGLRSEETIAVVKRESEIADRMLTKKRKIRVHSDPLSTMNVIKQSILWIQKIMKNA
ncbi:MAG: Arm DNA-binding domain-containing protein [Proteobacteria bacterium]|nr:Arm DNA-binding domain-containing protein [Pseudomonadota bacterium]